MKKIVIVLLLLVSLAIIKAIFSIPRNQLGNYLNIPDFIQWYPPDAFTPPIYEEKKIRQDFSPNFDGLAEIGLPFVWENRPASVLISLYKGKDQKHLIFKNKLLLPNLRKGEMFRFRFKPIISSKDKYFSLVVESPETGIDNNLRLYYSQRVFHISCRGPLYFNGKKVPGELSLIVNCRYDLKKGIITWPREKIRKDKLFFLCYGLILLGLLGTAIFYTMSFKSIKSG